MGLHLCYELGLDPATPESTVLARVAALREMWRVLRSGGCMVVAVWGSLHNQSGFAALEALFDRQLGGQTAAPLRAPFVLGDRVELAAMFGAAGIPDATVETRRGTARFARWRCWGWSPSS